MDNNILKKCINRIEHYCNPLHVFCKLVALGYNKDKSLSVCKLYEKLFYRYFSILINKAVERR